MGSWLPAIGDVLREVDDGIRPVGGDDLGHAPLELGSCPLQRVRSSFSSGTRSGGCGNVRGGSGRGAAGPSPALPPP
jgi:hypothetical protein